MICIMQTPSPCSIYLLCYIIQNVGAIACKACSASSAVKYDRPPGCCFIEAKVLVCLRNPQKHPQQLPAMYSAMYSALCMIMLVCISGAVAIGTMSVGSGLMWISTAQLEGGFFNHSRECACLVAVLHGCHAESCWWLHLHGNAALHLHSLYVDAVSYQGVIPAAVLLLQLVFL